MTRDVLQDGHGQAGSLPRRRSCRKHRCRCACRCWVLLFPLLLLHLEEGVAAAGAEGNSALIGWTGFKHGATPGHPGGVPCLLQMSATRSSTAAPHLRVMVLMPFILGSVANSGSM